MSAHLDGHENPLRFYYRTLKKQVKEYKKEIKYKPFSPVDT